MSAFFKIGTSVVAGLMLAALAGSARASYPESQSSAESAQMKADAARTRAAELAAQGGWAYKSGAVARAEADVRDLAGPHEVMTSQNEAVPSHNWGKPVEQTMHAYR